MSTLCIQVQPNRASSIDMWRVRALGEAVAADRNLVSRFAVVDGEDTGPYTNLLFETAELQELWSQLQETLYNDEQIGPALAQASMAMCEGNDGWNDYLLLYHFDPTVKLDDFNAR
jgi:hypothetical protein